MKGLTMADYPKEMVSRDGQTVTVHTPTEGVILQARGYTDVDTKSKPKVSGGTTKASPSAPKSEDATP